MGIELVFVILLVVGLIAALAMGYPVAFTLAGVSLIVGVLAVGAGAIIGTPVGMIDPAYFGLLPDRIFGIMTNDTLLAVPLFIAMGVTLERSKLADELLVTLTRLMGGLKGGLLLSVTLVGGLMAASTGIVGATVVTMGLISLPTMLKRGVDPALASGSIIAAGTLGQIIPPSIVLIILADVLSTSWQQAQSSMGIFSPTPLSVGDMFAGALLPGVMLVGLYMLYQFAIALFRPEKAPQYAHNPDDGAQEPLFRAVVRVLLPPIFLILAVLGSILTGVATPTEAAAVGAVGAILLSALRDNEVQKLAALGLIGLIGLLLMGTMLDTAPGSIVYSLAVLLVAAAALGTFGALKTLYRGDILQTVLQSTLKTSTMIFTILIGATLFALIFRGLNGDVLVEGALASLPGGVVGAVIVTMFVMFILGFVLDFIEISFVVVPIVAPTLMMMGVDPVWLGVMMAVNLQTSFLTPPFGFALFYLRGVAPKSLATSTLYKGVIPFIAIQLLALVLLSIFPELATWLPDVIFPS